MYKNILVIGSELQSHGIDKSTRGRSISVIFGDGAGAAILTREEDLQKGFYPHIYILKENMRSNLQRKHRAWERVG